MSKPAPPLFLTDEALLRGADLLYLAYHAVAQLILPMLNRQSLSSSQYRTLSFLLIQPGMTVGAVQQRLAISKQSFHRLLTPLIERGLVRQESGAEDRRERKLYLTSDGRTMLNEIEALIKSTMARAYKAAGAEAVGGFWAVLDALCAADAPRR